MSTTESESDDTPTFGNSTAAELYDQGFDTLAEFIDGPVRITALEPADLMAPLGEGWVLRAYNDESEIQYARSTTGDLIQIRDGDRDGDFGAPFECWPDEFGDRVLSGQYALEYIYSEDSAFEVADE